MCMCGHGQDRHYLDYAGPAVCGGISGRCLERGCNCAAFVFQTVTTTYPTVIYHPGYWTPLF